MYDLGAMISHRARCAARTLPPCKPVHGCTLAARSFGQRREQHDPGAGESWIGPVPGNDPAIAV